jgi:type IV secretory pathway TrbL component
MTLLYVAGAALAVWFAYRTIRSNPDMFSKENLSNSFFTMGILALLLIGFVALLVFLLKH